MKYSYTTYFAEIYDEVMKNVPYQYWFRYLKDILKYYKCQPNKILELASGTSNMTFNLINLESVNTITALDLSKAMISKAAEKLEYRTLNQKKFEKFNLIKNDDNYQLQNSSRSLKIKFSVQNMIDFSFAEEFDLILSFFDSLNYLTDIDQLQGCFDNAASSLSESGLFIFDMNSIGRIKTIAEKSFMIEGDNYECFWEDIVNEKENLWQVKLKICPDNDQLPCFEEVHSERGYKIKTILRLLKHSGFKAVDVYNAFSFARGKNNSDRLYFVAALDENRLQNNEGQLKKIYYSTKNRIDYFLVSLRYLF
ncbi:class I SAM-dependent DNA methyltransferase [Halanaerobium congolense]|jgi:SAM-dependent methyltransferase|uniref:Methyltransferase domain-containing protein n=1 Tax=Halanaerobium congolense TaxID=54121 RepID=A0A1G7FZ52_9FIRM|nr:class I SAM-dependent methyltransferase [Halanaerobium congolense]PTX16750.1 methyltransferase family protein [Halanaerobium congolense]PXV64352.1 methyltransferase family protein [Halanaerobium congolense]TDS30130.1 methyltransferase family protein [Halanaerobium congolense]TDX47967.1 methyltransferase family protein [Halanaerobium congolense]SDE81119.1 Methyltransferase domain-containing protein [Halanaerobium congolense]